MQSCYLCPNFNTRAVHCPSYRIKIILKKSKKTESISYLFHTANKSIHVCATITACTYSVSGCSAHRLVVPVAPRARSIPDPQALVEGCVGVRGRLHLLGDHWTTAGRTFEPKKRQKNSKTRGTHWTVFILH